MGLKRGVIVCVLASAAMHTAAVTQFAVPDTTLAAASPPPAMVSAGNSFADMVMGTPAPPMPSSVEPSEVEEATTQQPAPTTTQPSTPSQTAQAATGLQLDPERITDQVADIQATSLAPNVVEATAPLAAKPMTSTPPPITPTAPATTTPVTAPQPQTLEALPDVIVNDVTANTVRPPDRPSNLGQTPPPPTPQRTTQRATPAAPSGNAQQDTTRGAEAPAAPRAQQTTQGQGQQADQAAIAAERQAAANYPNQVVRHLSRTRHENTRIRGVATISFTIGASGQLNTLTVQRSSGNADLDRIAANHVRRAAPFPPPPPGARNVIAFEFQGRR